MRRLRAPSFPLEVFLWSRAGIWIATLLAALILNGVNHAPQGVVGAASARSGSGWALDIWGRWDGGWFLKIAHDGYADPHHTSAFFPLYPLLVRAAGTILGGHDMLGGVAVSLAACAGAFVLLHRLTRRLLGEADAARAVVYLALFPTALFLGAVYSESLYLLLSIGAFLAATRRRWLLAGVLCGLAILTRSAGVVLVPALALLAWQDEDRRGALARGAAVVPVAALWPAYLWARFGDPLLFVHAQSESFQRHPSTAGPFGGAWDALAVGWRSVRQLLGGGASFFPHVHDRTPGYVAALNLEQLGFAVLVVALGVVAWRRLGAAYGIVVLGSMLLPLSAPMEVYPLLSVQRFALAMFPIFPALATLGRNRRADVAIVGLSALLLGVEVTRWAVYAWVA